MRQGIPYILRTTNIEKNSHRTIEPTTAVTIPPITNAVKKNLIQFRMVTILFPFFIAPNSVEQRFVKNLFP